MDRTENFILQYEQQGAFDDDLPEADSKYDEYLCCPNCGGLNYSRYPIKNVVPQQYKEYICNECGYRFSEAE